jgi:hypothetical protein
VVLAGIIGQVFNGHDLRRLASWNEGAYMPQPRCSRSIHLPYVTGLLLLLIITSGVLPNAAHSHQEARRSGGAISGWVRDGATGQGVQATVHVGAQVLHTDAAGVIPSGTIPFDPGIDQVDVVVDAPGYPSWRYNNVQLSQRHPVELHVELGAPTAPSTATFAATNTAVTLDHPPDYINVGRTFNTTCVYPPTNVQRIDRVPFMVYVRNVLPFEWISSWPAASLDAGAVAASQFAWSTALVERKWTRRGYAFDVLDSTCDQVYQDRTAQQNFASTDAAVARMWGTVLLRDDKLITTYFRNTDERCGLVGGSDCMGQYGSRDRANEGMTGLDILHYYYDPITPTLRLPEDRAVIWEQSPDPVLQPGKTRTLQVRVLNVGASIWERSSTELVIVDPDAPNNSEYRSPFVHSSWIDTQHPATLSTSSLALGEDGTWRFTIAAPPDMEPGTYQLALRWQYRDGTAIPIEPAIRWTVTVTPPLQPLLWMPLAR